jgi:integrase
VGRGRAIPPETRAGLDPWASPLKPERSHCVVGDFCDGVVFSVLSHTTAPSCASDHRGGLAFSTSSADPATNACTDRSFTWRPEQAESHRPESGRCLHDRCSQPRLQTDTVKKLERIFERQFLPWTKTEGLEFIDEIDLDALISFRSTWTEGAVVKAKKQDRVIGFFWESFRRNYITQNPALSLSKIRPKHIPTDYFPLDEFGKILDATRIYGDPRGGYIPIEDTRTRLRTLTLLMRWSGLRIRDAVTLERHRLEGDSLLLYQAKTGQPVYVPLPPEVVEALRTIPDGPKPNPRYFFWSGNGMAKSAVADWQRSYRRLFQLADIRKLDGKKKRCHPHMFRDTFAVEMLLAAVPIDQVSTLLGHSSVKVTERHYAPFVKARQLQLQASVRAAWKVGEARGEDMDWKAPEISDTAGEQNEGEFNGNTVRQSQTS